MRIQQEFGMTNLFHGSKVVPTKWSPLKRRSFWLYPLLLTFLICVGYPITGIAEELLYIVCPSELTLPSGESNAPFGRIPVGCQLVDCCPDCPAADRLDWYIELEGELVESLTLQFDNVSHDTARAITLHGNIAPVNNTPQAYRLTKGDSDIHGLPSPVPAKTWSSSMQRIETFMRADTEHWPMGFIKDITLNPQKVAQAESALFSVGRGVNNKLGVIHFEITQRLGKFMVNETKIRIVVVRCMDQMDGVQKTDRINIPAKGIGLGVGLVPPDNAVIMVDGRRASSWTNDEIFRDSAMATAPLGNYWHDDDLCAAQNGNEPCHSEVAIFEKNSAMRLDSPVSVWTDSPIDVHNTTSRNSPLEVPLKIWVLWENGDPADPTIPTSASLADSWVIKANQLYDETRCGIQFNIIGTSDKVAEANSTTIDNNNRTLQQVACEEREIGLLKETIGYDSNVVNVYFTGSHPDTIPGWTCDSLDPNVILIRTPMAQGGSDTTVAHEFGHTLSLEHVNNDNDASYDYNGDGDPDFSPDNIMWGGGFVRNKISLGQCFRCNLNRGSALYRNNIVSPDPARDVPRGCYSDTLKFKCPWLGKTE